jgi:hypothetical protein
MAWTSSLPAPILARPQPFLYLQQQEAGAPLQFPPPSLLSVPVCAQGPLMAVELLSMASLPSSASPCSMASSSERPHQPCQGAARRGSPAGHHRGLAGLLLADELMCSWHLSLTSLCPQRPAARTPSPPPRNSPLVQSPLPRRVSSLSCLLRSPICDAVKTRGEKPPAVLDVYFSMCVMFDELPPTNLCVFAASGRCRASRLARSTKCRAMWTAHASSPDSFRLIDL